MKIIFSLALAFCLLQLGVSLQRTNYLKCGQVLNVNEWINSNDQYYAIVQGDCNFVVYASKHFVPRNALWSSGTSRKDCTNPRLVNQKDGNLVLYDNNKSIWSTKTNKSGNNCYRLIMQQDGNLVLYNQKNVAMWNTKTSA